MIIKRLLPFRTTPFHDRNMALPNTHDPHSFCDDVTAAREGMKWLFRIVTRLRQMLRKQAAFVQDQMRV